MLGNLGNAYQQLGDTMRSLEFYEKSLALRRDLGDLNGIASDSFNLSVLYAKQGDIVRSIKLAKDSTKIFTQTGNPNIQQAQALVAYLENLIENN